MPTQSDLSVIENTLSKGDPFWKTTVRPARPLQPPPHGHAPPRIVNLNRFGIAVSVGTRCDQVRLLEVGRHRLLRQTDISHCAAASYADIRDG